MDEFNTIRLLLCSEKLHSTSSLRGGSVTNLMATPEKASRRQSKQKPTTTTIVRSRLSVSCRMYDGEEGMHGVPSYPLPSVLSHRGIPSSWLLNSLPVVWDDETL